MQEYDYEAITAETFRAKTIVPTVENPCIKVYEIDAENLSAFVSDMNHPEHAEEIVDIEALSNE